MTPKLLIFSAFGPYVETQTIDFSKFAVDGLFLIRGETGSGKTAILDAMTYALYGKSSGNGRGELENMRCQLSPADAETRVEFVFELRGKQYKFKRTFTVRKKRNGETEFKVDQNAFYLDDSGSFVPYFESNRKKDMDSKAEALIGLSYEQFRQVIILPQGQFENFLVADTKVKENILVTLFKAEKWNLIAEWLCDQAALLQGSIKEEESGIAALLQAKECKTAEDLQAKTETTTQETQAKQAEKELAAELCKQSRHSAQQARDLHKLFSESEQAAEAYKTIQSEQPQMDALLQTLIPAQKAERLTEKWAQLKIARTEQQTRLRSEQEAFRNVERAQTQQFETHAARLAMDAQEQSIEAQKKKHAQLTGLQSIYERFDAAKAAAAQAERACIDAGLIAAGGEEQLQKLHKEKAELDGQRDLIIREHTTLLPALQKQYDRLTDAQARTRQLQEQRLLLAQLEKQFLLAKQQLAISKGQLELRQAAYNELHTLYLANTAAALSAELADGSPCPVCGSLHHPAKAHASHASHASHAPHASRGTVESGALKKSADAVETQRSDIASEEQKLATLVSKKESATEKIEELLKALAESPDYSPENRAAVKAALDASELANAALPECSRKLDLAALAIDKAQTAADEQKRVQQEKASLKEASTAQYNALLSQLDPALPDLAALMSELVRLQTEIAAYLRSKKAVDEAHDAANLLLHAEKSKLESACIERAKADICCAQLLDAFSTQLQTNGFVSEEAFALCVLPKSELESSEQRLFAYNARKDKAAEALEKLTLQLEGSTKPDLAQIEAALATHIANETAAHDDYSRLRMQLEQLNTLLSDILSRQKTLARQKEAYEKLHEFGVRLRGDRGISLRRYVLGVMLSSITSEANRLLKNVHDGRYQLYRTLEGTGRALKVGLDLEVFDAYSGEKRPVGGLSGGEKFLVALSLSLGLSSVVQAQSGGIRMDAMFIDEGFGTLDPHSIQNALDVLASVRGAARLIGIISHVQMLRENIPASIEVKKSRLGSTLVFNV